MFAIRNQLRFVLAVAVLPVALAGCVSASKQQAGTGIGAVVGGVLGSQVGSGSGRRAATVIGAVAGGIIGNQIGRYLDERDRERARAASQKALDTGTTQSWQNRDSGNSGTAQVVNASAAGSSPERPCRTIKQTIALKDGTSREEEVTACKGPNGWETV